MSRSIKLIELDDSDVVNNYSWTVSNSTLARDEVPVIKITEYQQNVSSITQAAKFWAMQATSAFKEGRTKDPYAGLYAVAESEPGNTYHFPFYSSYHHQITNSWGQNKGIMTQTANKIAEFATNVGGAIYPSAGIEQAKSWEGGEPAMYTINFQLLNTVNPQNDIQKNRTLINALISNNLKDKIDFLVTRPPAICEVEIPGIRSKNIAVMSMINIENRGQINSMTINGKRINVPDAYDISIHIQELLNESRQILRDGANAIVQTTIDLGGLDDATDNVRNAAESGMDLIRNTFGT